MRTCFALLLITLLFSCQQTSSPSGSLAFDYQPINKSDLERNGFTPIKWDLRHPSEQNQPITPDDIAVLPILRKVVNDTSIEFSFEQDVMERKVIRINLKKFDSLTLFQNLRQMGFIDTTKEEASASFALYYPKTKQTYHVSFSPSNVFLSQVLTQKKSKPQEFAPPAIEDSVWAK